MLPYKNPPNLTELDMYKITDYNRLARSSAPDLPCMAELWKDVDNIAGDVGIDDAETKKALDGLYADHHVDMVPVVDYQNALAKQVKLNYQVARRLMRLITGIFDREGLSKELQVQIEEVQDAAMELIPESRWISGMNRCFTREMWDILIAGRLANEWLHPDLDASAAGGSPSYKTEINRKLPDGKYTKVEVVWNGSLLIVKVPELDYWFTLSGSQIYIMDQGGVPNFGVPVAEVEEYVAMFDDWLNPTYEEIKLYQMAYPGNLFPVDIYKVLDVLDPSRKPIEDI